MKREPTSTKLPHNVAVYPVSLLITGAEASMASPSRSRLTILMQRSTLAEQLRDQNSGRLHNTPHTVAVCG